MKHPSPPVHGTVVAFVPDKTTAICAVCGAPGTAWLRYDATGENGGVGWHPMCGDCALRDKRFVIFDEELGVFLGEDDACASFWSRVDHGGQTSACTFESEGVALAILAVLAARPGTRPTTGQAVPVTADDGGEYASIAELTAVGLTGWEVS